MSWRGVLAGMFGLVVLQVLVANPNAYGAVGGIFGVLGNGVRLFLDPTVPAIPDRSKPAPSSSTSSGFAPYVPGPVSLGSGFRKPSVAGSSSSPTANDATSAGWN